MDSQQPPSLNGGILGQDNVARYVADPLKFLAEISAYGDLVRFQMGAHQIYLLNRPDLVKQVCLNNWQKLKKPELIKASNRGYWGDGLTTLEGSIWRKQRHLMQPAFHQNRIATYARTIVDCTREMLANWEAGSMVNIDREMLLLTARIAARTLFDAELEGFGSPVSNQQRSGIIGLAEALGEDLTVTRNSGGSTSTVMTRRRAGEKMDATVKIIQERFAAPDDRGDMLSFLLQATYEDGSRMTEEEVTGEVMQMFFAGHHTIPSTLIWLWYVLSQNPEIENNIHLELNQVLGGRSPSMEDLPRFPYGEMVIKETMRFYAPAPILFREIVDDIQLDLYTLKQDALIWISPYLLHRDPQNFTQPEDFIPERFSKEKVQQIPKHAYLPFGVEPRVCIGHGFAMMTIRLILATIAQSYRLTLASGQSVVPKVFLTIRPEKEIYMQVVPYF
jgi:cytochrome P450